MSAEILTGDINFSNVNESSPSFFKKIGSFIKKCIDAIKKFIAKIRLHLRAFFRPKQRPSALAELAVMNYRTIMAEKLKESKEVFNVSAIPGLSTYNPNAHTSKVYDEDEVEQGASLLKRAYDILIDTAKYAYEDIASNANALLAKDGKLAEIEKRTTQHIRFTIGEAWTQPEMGIADCILQMEDMLEECDTFAQNIIINHDSCLKTIIADSIKKAMSTLRINDDFDKDILSEIVKNMIKYGGDITTAVRDNNSNIMMFAKRLDKRSDELENLSDKYEKWADEIARINYNNTDKEFKTLSNFVFHLSKNMLKVSRHYSVVVTCMAYDKFTYIANV